MNNKQDESKISIEETKKGEHMSDTQRAREERLAYFRSLVKLDTRLMDLFDRAVDCNGNGVFLKEYETGRTITWEEMDRLVKALAKGMMKYHIRKGDHVLIWGANSIKWVACFLACLKIGAVSILGNTANKERETSYLLKDGDVRMILMDQGQKSVDYKKVMEVLAPGCCQKQSIVSEEFPVLQYVVSFEAPEGYPGLTIEQLIEEGAVITDEELERRAQEIKATDIINIQYTSGTTGEPKGTMWDQHCMLYNLQGISVDLDLKPGAKLYTSLPFFHNFGLLGCIVYPILCCAASVFSKKFRPEAFLQALSEEKPDMIMGVTTMFLAMLASPNFHSCHIGEYPMKIVLAGSLCPQNLLEALRNDFRTDQVLVVYGLTEAAASANTNMSDPLEQQLTSIGRPSGEYQFKICDPVTREPLPNGTSGEIAIKGIAVMKGYYKKKLETARVFDSEGWFYTGDIAYQDDQGYFYISGRAKDMINRGGEKIFPKELENFLLSHPEITDAQVIGIPSKLYGEEVMAYIIKKPGSELTEEEVKQYVKKHMAIYKTPKYVRFIDHYPCTLSGKVQKFKLIERAKKELGL